MLRRMSESAARTDVQAHRATADRVAIRRTLLARTDSVVVKVGTNVLSGADDRIDTECIESLAESLAAIRSTGRRVVLVSSGSIGIGLGLMGLVERPSELPQLQAAASLGQARLISTYDKALERWGLHASQILLTANDFKDRARYLNTRNTLSALASIDCIPIVNENDTVSIKGITLGDNDRLASLVTSLMPSPLLVILTTADGLLNGPPSNPASRRIPVVRDWNDDVRAVVSDEGSSRGTGGMRSKLDAVRMAVEVGETVIVADGRKSDTLERILRGDDVGTLFEGRPQSMPAWKRWIAQAVPPGGTLRINAGAAQAVVRDGRSLLAVGVEGVDGQFDRGDVVAVVGPDGPLARGLVNYDSDDSRRLAGRNSSEFADLVGSCSYRELIHRDNLVLVDSD